MRKLICFLFTISALNVFGQESQEIHQYFDFKDGIYLSHEALMKNQPDIAITTEVKGVYNNQLKILRVNPIDFGLQGSTSIAYVVEQGLPYARVTRCCPDQVIYVGLTIVGHLSVLSFESEEMVDIPMTAYNPYNNKPFLKGSVKREKAIEVIQVIDLSSGNRFDINDEKLVDLLNSESTFPDLDNLIENVSRFNKNNKIQVVQQ